MSLKEKISTFNKPQQNEDEVRDQQKKKASFNAKFAKFETNEAPSIKDSAAKQKAKMFEEYEGKQEREKEAVIRKEDFAKKKGKFAEDNKEIEEEVGTLADKKSVFEQKENVEENQDDTSETEKKKKEFLEKQTVFGQ